MIRDVHHRGIGDGAQQVADKTVEFRIGNEVSRLLVAKSSAEHTRQAEQRSVATGQAIWTAVGADQLTLDAKGRGVKRNEINVFERGAINRLAKHDSLSRQHQEKNQGKLRWRG